MQSGALFSSSGTGAMPQKTPASGAVPQSINDRDRGAINYREHAHPRIHTAEQLERQAIELDRAFLLEEREWLEEPAA